MVSGASSRARDRDATSSFDGRPVGVDVTTGGPVIDLQRRGVPFVDLITQHRQTRDEILAAWTRILDGAAFIGGPAVSEFESALAAYVGAKHAVGVANGTDALTLALRALGVAPGDEVVTAANTYFATVEAIVHAGAVPRLVDVDPDTATMSPAAFERAVNPRTRAVIPVHLYGQPADMDEIRAVADAYGIRVLEDNAQALGASYRGRPTGSLGDAAAISFYPGKNLGACGDAGAITTDDDQVAEHAKVLRDHGQAGKHRHVAVGYNSRLDALQAAALSIKLKRLDTWNAARRSAAHAYRQALSPALEAPIEAPDRLHVYHLFVVRHARRDALSAALGANGIGTGLHYPVPIHLTEAFSPLGEGEGSYPHAERWASEGLSLPMHPYLTADDVATVSAAMEHALEGLGVLTRHLA